MIREGQAFQYVIFSTVGLKSGYWNRLLRCSRFAAAWGFLPRGHGPRTDRKPLAAIVLSFVCRTANRGARVPRKPLEKTRLKAHPIRSRPFRINVQPIVHGTRGKMR